MSWDVVETAQGDLLAMLIDRVEPATGVPVLLGLSTISRDHDEDAQAKTILTAIMNGLDPKFAKTILASLAAGWRTAAGRPIDAGPELIRAEGQRAVRRLRALDLPEDDMTALDHLQTLFHQTTATSEKQL